MTKRKIYKMEMELLNSYIPQGVKDITDTKRKGKR